MAQLMKAQGQEGEAGGRNNAARSSDIVVISDPCTYCHMMDHTARPRIYHYSTPPPLPGLATNPLVTRDI